MKRAIKTLVPVVVVVCAAMYVLPKLYGDIRDRRPVWSPDGRFLAFVSNRRQPGSPFLSDDRPSHLWLIGADGKGLRPLTPREELSRPVTGSPMWSPDGGRLLVESGVRYWIVPVAEGEPKALEPDVSSPRWSPDGKSILYTSLKDSRIENIWIAAADGSAAKPLTRMTRPNTDCSGAEWSPDGTRILYLSLRALDGSDTINEEGALNLWVMDADGSNPRVVARFQDPDASPSSAEWLPGGKEIVFHATGKDEGGIPTLGNYWILNDDGAERRPLSRDLPVLHCRRGLKSSPDGRKLLCESFDSPLRKQKGNETLWLYDRDANAQRPLTQDVKEEASRDARWSPDGSRIAFSRHTVGFLDGSADRIWIMDAEGKNAKALIGR